MAYTTGLKSSKGNWSSFIFDDDNDLKTTVESIQGLRDEIYANTITNALTANECKLFIKMSEEFGYSESPSTTEFFRKSQLSIFDMGLTRKELRKFSANRLFSIVLLEVSL